MSATPSEICSAQVRRGVLYPALLLLAGLLAYANCYQGEFVLDDEQAILTNPHVTSLWPLSQALSAPRGTTAAGRPVTCLSFALNYAAAGYRYWAYRAADLALHLAAALLLFGLVRRTLSLEGVSVPRLLRSGPLVDTRGTVSAPSPLSGAKGARAADGIAFAAALLWLVHPLHTQLIDYVGQRSEQLAALFLITTLYCAARALTPPPAGGRGMGRGAGRGWKIAAVAACALGMGAKETMAAAPLAVLLFDRAFFAGSFAQAVKRAKLWYLALFATWAILLLLVLQGGTAEGAHLDHPRYAWTDYAAAQPRVILHYLHLAFWPDALCFDYKWPAAQSVAAELPAIAALAVLLAGSLYAVIRNSPWGFAGALFFLALAPSSSVLPLPDVAAEYRMYLPLAVLAVCVAAGGYAVLQRLAPRRLPLAAATLLASAALVLGTLTLLRTEDYRSALALWTDTLQKAPQNPRALINLCLALTRRAPPAAAAQYLHVLCGQSEAEAYTNLGKVFAIRGHNEEALAQFQSAVARDPQYAEAWYNLGRTLTDLNRPDDAAEAYGKAERLRAGR